MIQVTADSQVTYWEAAESGQTDSGKVLVMRWLALTLILVTSHFVASADGGAFSHGTATCLEGSEGGPGVRLFLRQDKRCDGKVGYPCLTHEQVLRFYSYRLRSNSS